jgi:thiol-disulfide isomerase/thioredoxin
MRRLFLVAILAVAPLLAVSAARAGELKSFVRGSWQSILAAHSGSAFIVHFWGLTCGPCRAELPVWGKLFADKPDLPLVTVDADMVLDAPGAVEDFLAKSGLQNAENWIFDDNFVERLRYEVDPKWQGEIPVTLLIGRNGSIGKIEGSAKISEISAWLTGQQKPIKQTP